MQACEQIGCTTNHSTNNSCSQNESKYINASSSNIPNINVDIDLEVLRHVNSRWMNAATWREEMKHTGHTLACPYHRGWGFLGSWGLSKLGCVKIFEGLRADREYVTLTRADMELFFFGKINDGLLGPLPGLLSPIIDPFEKFAAVADRAVSVAAEFAAVGKDFAAVADRAVSCLFWAFIVHIVVQMVNRNA